MLSPSDPSSGLLDLADTMNENSDTGTSWNSSDLGMTYILAVTCLLALRGLP